MYNVLIADDEPSICEGLRTIINWNEYGFHVLCTASDGEEALARLKESRYNLVVTDIRMPVMDGLALVKEISRSYPSIKSLIISGYNDFNYAKKAIEYGVSGYLLKPIDQDELIQYVLSVKESLDQELETYKLKIATTNMAIEKLFLDYTSGNLDNKTFQEKLSSYNLHLYGDRLKVALIEVDGFYSMVENNLSDANLIKFGVKNIASEVLEESGSSFIYEDIDGIIGILFSGTQDILKDSAILELLEKISYCIKKYINTDVTIGIGQTVSLSQQVKISRNQARQCLVLKSSADIGKVITAGEVIDAENTIFNISWDSQSLLSAIEEYDEARIQTEINILIGEIKNKRFSSDVVKFCLNNILFEVVHILRKYGYTDDISLIQQKFSSIENSNLTIEKIHEILSSICGEVSYRLTKAQKNAHPCIISQIQKYVQEHYSEDINLKSISNVFYMNPVYLGRLFKNTVGINFSDYVNKVRISEVKKMLLSDEHKIFEIIELAGYNNQEYFYKVFRKYEGVSFSEYKEKVKKGT